MLTPVYPHLNQNKFKLGIMHQKVWIMPTVLELLKFVDTLIFQLEFLLLYWHWPEFCDTRQSLRLLYQRV